MTAWLKKNWKVIAIVAGCFFGVPLLWHLTFGGSGTKLAAIEDSGFIRLFALILVVLAAMVIIRFRDSEKNYPPFIPYLFVGMAALAIIVTLKLHTVLFGWTTLGSLVVAFFLTLAHLKTDGSIKSFFGFSTGIVLSVWLIMFVKSNLNININLDFLGDRVTDNVNLIIGLLAASLFLFLFWKRSRIWKLVFLFVLSCWLGPEVFDRMATRSPISNPGVPQTWKSGGNSIIDGVGNVLEKVGEAFKNFSISTTGASIPPPSSSASASAPTPVTSVSPATSASPPAATSSTTVPATISKASASAPSSPPAVSAPAPTAVASTPGSPPASMPATASAGVVFDNLLMMRESPIIALRVGKYTSSNPKLAYASDGSNFVPISGNQFEVKAGDRNPRIRALEGGAFKIQIQRM